MKYTGRYARVNKDGKINIPPKILKQIGIDDKSLIEFVLVKNGIAIKKKHFTCLVTGIKSDDVKEILPGIYLSERGQELLLDELKKNQKFL